MKRKLIKLVLSVLYSTGDFFDLMLKLDKRNALLIYRLQEELDKEEGYVPKDFF